MRVERVCASDPASQGQDKKIKGLNLPRCPRVAFIENVFLPKNVFLLRICKEEETLVLLHLK